MIDLDADVIVVGTPGAPGAAVLAHAPTPERLLVDDQLAGDLTRLVEMAAAHPTVRIVPVVCHPYATVGGTTRREAEEAWVNVTGNLVDLIERIGGDRCYVARWEDLANGDTADLRAFLDTSDGAASRPPAARPVVRAARDGAGHRPSRAARALASELGYDLGESAPAAQSRTTAVIRPARRGVRVPASSAQQRLLFLDAIEPGLAVHHLPVVRRVAGSLDMSLLERSLSAVVARHEALRTDFELVDGEWFQVVVPPAPVTIEFADLRSVPADQRDRALSEAIAHEVRRPFNVRSGLKIRALVLRTEDDVHVFVTTLHHIASDGSSIVQLTTDMGAFYEAAVRGGEPSLPELPVQYADFTLWQRAHAESTEFAAELDYWRRTLAGPLPVLDIPADRLRPAMFSHDAGSVSIEIDAETTATWRAAARATGVTPFMFLLATYTATLARWSGADDVVVGIANANRRAETEHVVGLFASTLPVRVAVDSEGPFTRLLDEVKRQTLGALANQDVPFDEIVHIVNPPRDLSRSPIFQTLFVLNNMRPAVLGEVGGITIEDIATSSPAVEVDLSVVLEEGPAGLAGRIDFPTALFDPATVQRFTDHWGRLLAAAAADPSTAVVDLPILSQRERDVLQHEFASPVPGPATVEGVTRIDELVGLRVLAAPDALAFTHHGDVLAETLTYAEWDRWANQIARRLMQAGIGPGSRVGVAVARSTAMVTSVLAVLKCGAAYVPLDPDLPPERLAYMIDDAEVSVALVSNGSLDHLSDVELTMIDVVGEAASIAEIDGGPIAVDTSDAPGGGAAWVIYTSGSTGRPKGVEVEHSAAINFLLAMRDRPGVAADDVLLAVPTLSFDPSVLDLFVPALAGSRVVIADRADIVDGVRLAALIERSAATIMQATPTTWSMLFQSGWAGSARLKALCGGEAMPIGLARQMLAGCSSVWNIYGPTETTVWSSVHQVTESSLQRANVPVGVPIPNLVYRIVDTTDQLVPIGVPGEILIGGAGLARGYLNQPELTADRFVPDPIDPSRRVYRTGDVGRWLPDGNLEFFGRRDFQIKLHGNRIELGEIEAALRELDAVGDAVVVADDDKAATRLIAYVTVPAGSEALSSIAMRAALQRRLPVPMIPNAFVTLDAFPLTPSGKIDRRALPAPEKLERARVDEPPRDAVEARLAQWFAAVLGHPSVGIHDDFFELGGFSLMATRLFATIEAETGRRIPMVTLFEAPTVAALAEHLRDDTDAGTRSAPFQYLVPITKTGDRVPIFCVHGSGGNVLILRDLALKLGSSQPFYGLQARGVDGVLRPHESIEEMAADYLTEIREVQPHGPYVFAGYSGGGLVAFEMARQISEVGEPVAHVVLLDTYPPVVPKPPHPVRDRIERIRDEKLKYLAHIVVRRVGARQYRQRLARLDELLARGSAVPPDLRQPYVDRSFVDASRRYVLRPHAVRITLVRTETLYYSYRGLGPAYEWDTVIAHGLDVIRVPGAHQNLVLDPFAERVAEVIRERVWPSIPR